MELAIYFIETLKVLHSQKIILSSKILYVDTVTLLLFTISMVKSISYIEHEKKLFIWLTDTFEHEFCLELGPNRG